MRMRALTRTHTWQHMPAQAQGEQRLQAQRDCSQASAKKLLVNSGVKDPDEVSAGVSPGTDSGRASSESWRA